MFGYVLLRGWTEKMEDNLKELAELGYKGVDIWRPPRRLGTAQELKGMLEKYDLEAVCITALGPNMMSEDTINYASDIGAKYINTHSNIDLLNQELIEYADVKGIRFVIHPHPRTPVENSQDVSKYLLKHPKLMLSLDTANLSSAGSDPIEAIEKFGDRIGFTHLKDWNSNTRRPCELGEGTINWSDVFNKLKQVNFTDWQVVECANLGSKDSAIKCRDYLKEKGFWT